MIRNPNPRPNRVRPHNGMAPPANNEDAVRFLEERRKPLVVVKTTRTPSGQVLDWVPIEAQHPQGKIATPPPAGEHVQRSEPTRRAATFEMDDPSIERGPPGTVPVLRRDLSRLRSTETLSDVPRKRKVDGRRLTPRSGKLPAADPDPFHYYHATSAQWATCYGCEAVLNMWDPYTEYSSDHSISQFGMQNYDNPRLQSIEAGWEVCHDQYGDWLPHLFTYYTTDGYTGDGDNLGGYNRDFAGWVQYDPNVFPGILINGSSTYGGNQDIITIKFQLYQGNWWFQAQGIWMGYYPASLFGGGPGGAALGDHAEWVAFWGEVYSSLADPSQTTTWMGSGNFAEDGWTWSAYQSNTRIQIDGNGTMADSDGSPSAENPAMYDIQSNMVSGSSWASYFWFGGPGV
jgi:Neprosin